MSARNSVPAIDTGPLLKVKPPKARRSLSRRIARIALRGFGAIVMLLVLVVAFLHTPWGKSVVRGRIEKALAKKINGSVRVGGLDYGFLFSSVSLSGIEIRDASGNKAISVDSIDLALDRGALVHKEIVLDSLAIAGVNVRVTKRADGTSNLTGLFKPSPARKPLGHVQVRHLTVAGAATVTKPDGRVIEVRDLRVAGSIDAHPAAKETAATLDQIAASVFTSGKQIDVAIDGVTLHRTPSLVDAKVAKIAAGALGIEGIAAHIALEGGKPRGQQTITLGKAHVDSKQLAALAGRQILVGDIALDLSLAGPAEALALTGTVRTGETSLGLSGLLDIAAAVPSYNVSLVADARTQDVVVPRPGKRAIPAVSAGARIDLRGQGIKRGAIHADLAVDFQALGFAITGGGSLAGSSLDGRFDISGSPVRAMEMLAAAGVVIPKKAPRIGALDLVVDAHGKLDGELAVTLAPTKIAIAGGSVGIHGDAVLDNKKLRVAHANIALSKLDLASLSRLAGRPPKANGTLSGTLAVTRTATSRDAAYDLTVALADKPLVVTAAGKAGATAATAHAEVRRASDRSVLAALDAKLPLDAKGFAPTGAMRISIDVARRQIAELSSLVSPRLRAKLAKLPAGSDISVHADLAGSPAQPTGTITVASTGRHDVALTATLAPSGSGVAITTSGSFAFDKSTFATLQGTVAVPALFRGKRLDIAAVRSGLTVDAVVTLPERPIASLASLRAKLAKLAKIDGTLGGQIAVRGALKTPAIDAALAWRGYRTATGASGETTLTASGTPTALDIALAHGTSKAVALTAHVDRSSPDRIAIAAHARAAKTALLPLLPAFAAASPKLAKAELGTLDWNMDADLVLARGATGALALSQAQVIGTLDVAGGAFALPNTKRRFHDIALSVVGEHAGIRIKNLALHESDRQKADRRVSVSGLLALDNLRPRRLDLSLAAQDWLLSGGEKFGKADAPRATATFDIGVGVDLTQPIIAVDATVHSLALRSPDRQERAHYVENISPGGDIIFVDGKHDRSGKLPVALLPVMPAVTATPKKRRPLDIRVHIPKAIRLEQTPMDMMARGELSVTVRDEGVKTRGTLTMESGKLELFGHVHKLTSGKVSFTDEHPKGMMELTFERELPDYAKRELAANADGARITFTGNPTKPKVALSGAAGAGMFDVMSMYNAGHSINVSRPGMPASATIEAPRGDQFFMLTFMASNLRHLLFLDRITAWSGDPQRAYGQVTNVEAERYSKNGKSRVRAVVRPSTPGRSNTEVQYDRLLINNDRTAVGVGVRAGDRLGGGVGVFLEWSSR